MLIQTVFRDLYDYQKFGLRPWLLVYLLAIALPFIMIAISSVTHAGKGLSFLLDITLTGIGIYSLLSTIIAIAQLFWTTVSTPEFTNEKMFRLLLTYFYMLLAFAGIYMVLYFISDYELAHLETLHRSGARSSAAPKALALSGVDLRLWSMPEPGLGLDTPQFQWANLPLVYIDMLYFSMTTLTTLGFGDILAKDPFVKIIVMFEAIFGNLLLVLGVASIVPRKDSGT